MSPHILRHISILLARNNPRSSYSTICNRDLNKEPAIRSSRVSRRQIRGRSTVHRDPRGWPSCAVRVYKRTGTDRKRRIRFARHVCAATYLKIDCFIFPTYACPRLPIFPLIETGGAGRGRRCRRPRKNVKIIIVRSADRNYYPITADAASRVSPPTSNTARCLDPSRAHVHRRRRKRDIRLTLKRFPFPHRCVLVPT